MAKRRPRKRPSQQPILKIHANGAVSIGGKFVSKEKARKHIESGKKTALTKQARSEYGSLTKKKLANFVDTTLTKAPKKKRRGKPRGGVSPTQSFAETVRNGLAGTRVENVGIRRFGNTIGGPTLHKYYIVDPTDKALANFASRFPGRLVNLVVVYQDKSGAVQYRSASNVASEEIGLGISLFDQLLNRYNSAKEIGNVLWVEADVWDSEGPGWNG